MAATKIVLLPEALSDIRDARDWYERRQGLGGRFLDAVDACIETIRDHPEICPVVYKGYRRTIVRRFPYLICYEYVGGVVIIYGVFHASRDPQHWQSRLP